MQQAVLSRGDEAYWCIWFLKNNFEIFYFVRVRARYKLRLVFRLSTFCSKFKFMLSAGIQLFGLKTTSQGKPDLKKFIFEVRFTLRWHSGWGSGWGWGKGTPCIPTSPRSLRAVNFSSWKPLHKVNLNQKPSTSPGMSPHLKSDPGNEFFGSGLPCEVVFRPKSWIPAENLNLLQTRLSLKTRLSLYLALTMTKK